MTKPSSARLDEVKTDSLVRLNFDVFRLFDTWLCDVNPRQKELNNTE